MWIEALVLVTLIMIPIFNAGPMLESILLAFITMATLVS